MKLTDQGLAFTMVDEWIKALCKAKPDDFGDWLRSLALNEFDLEAMYMLMVCALRRAGMFATIADEALEAVRVIEKAAGDLEDGIIDSLPITWLDTDKEPIIDMGGE